MSEKAGETGKLADLPTKTMSPLQLSQAASPWTTLFTKLYSFQLARHYINTITI